MRVRTQYSIGMISRLYPSDVKKRVRGKTIKHTQNELRELALVLREH